MNIQLLTPKMIPLQKRCDKKADSTVSCPKLNTLDRDTVSFGSAASTFADFVTDSFSKASPRMQRISTNYLDSLEVVASRLKDHGFSIDRSYCELSPVKSPESCTSKVIRSKSFKIPDSIRATLYCNSPYELDNLNFLFAEMKKRGYVLSETEMSVKDLIKRGYVPTAEDLKDTSKLIKVPDLDIRLENVSEQIGKLPDDLRYSISKPQKSGYEDIQMRFVRDYDKKENPVQHELIILFGPEYSKAKHIESEKVYSNLRRFSELRLNLEENSAVGSNSNKANRYIDLIRQMFRGKISEKLFLNAKNKDLYDITEEVPIKFAKNDVDLFSNYFKGLKDRINGCYREMKESTTDETALKQLRNNQRHDSSLLTKIEEGLRKTIDDFNNPSKKSSKSKQ